MSALLKGEALMFGPDWEELQQYLKSHPLAGSIPTELFSYYIRAGMALGDAIARKTSSHFIGLGCAEILNQEGISIHTGSAPLALGVQILAEYQPQLPAVTVYPDRLNGALERLSFSLGTISPRASWTSPWRTSSIITCGTPITIRATGPL